MKTIFDENNDLLEEQANELRNKQETIDSLNSQIMDLYKIMEENANKVIEKEDELNYLQEIIDRNEHQLQTLNDKFNRTEDKVQKLELELQKKSQEMEALNQQCKAVDKNDEIEEIKKKHEITIKDLESKNKEQLEKLKKFAANLKKKNAQCSELEQKLERLQNNSSSDDNQTTDLTQKLEDLQQILFQKEQEINVMKHESSRVAVAVQQSSSVQDNTKIEQLKTSHDITISKMSDEIDNLTHQLSEAHQQLAELNRSYHSDSSNKSAELENLKLRLNEKVQLTDELAVDVEKKNSELLTLQKSLQELNASMTTISDDLKSKNVKIEKCRAVIKDKNQTIQKLTTSVAEYQRKLEEQLPEKSTTDPIQPQYERLQEEFLRATKGYEERIAGLQLELEAQKVQLTNFGGMEIKNQENEHYIESLRETNNKLNDKIAKLEEGIGHIEERRSSLERHADLLGSTLREKTSEFQKNEDELLSRLQALSQHDETIEKRLNDADIEKQELIVSLSEASQEKNELIKKLQVIETQMSELQNTTLMDLENENATLTDQVKGLKQELKRQSSEFERISEEQKNAIVELENDLSTQLQRLSDERRDLQHNLEKCKDQNNELNCDIVRFKEIITSLEQANTDLENEMTWIKMQNENMNQDHIENQELRMQVVHDQTEIENLKEQTETLQQNHEREVTALKQQIIELDSLRAQIGQNQTDDQVFIQNENERLQALLATKDLEIQNYQRQNLQLQMSFASAPAVSDPFNSISAAAHTSPTNVDSDESLILSKNIADLEVKLESAVKEITALQEQNTALQLQNSQKDTFIQETNKTRNEQLDKIEEEFKNQLSQLEQQNKELHDLSEQKEAEVNRLRAENEKHSDVAISQSKVDEMQLQIHQRDQYIADLQIQLRISTNDCEQTVQTIQSLEQEIQSRTAKYQEEIASLRLEVDRLATPQAVQEIFAQKTMIAASAAEPQQFLTDIEKQIISNDPTQSGKQSELPSFNSSMFFGSTEPTAFDSAFSSSRPDSAYPKDEYERTPVVEPLIIPKKTYLCHPDQSQTETTVIPDDSGDYSNRIPVVEAVCVTKKTYVCHPEEEVNIATADDGWGFGSDDAILEEKHQQMTGSLATSSLVPAHIGQTLQEYEDSVSFIILFSPYSHNLH